MLVSALALAIQRAMPGSGGHTSDSNWVGGKGYNSLAESYPYWLNGAVPLAVPGAPRARLGPGARAVTDVAARALPAARSSRAPARRGRPVP